jgi:hypothetical protein
MTATYIQNPFVLCGARKGPKWTKGFICLTRHKISDGYRERASIEVKGFVHGKM